MRRFTACFSAGVILLSSGWMAMPPQRAYALEIGSGNISESGAEANTEKTEGPEADVEITESPEVDVVKTEGLETGVDLTETPEKDIQNQESQGTDIQEAGTQRPEAQGADRPDTNDITQEKELLEKEQQEKEQQEKAQQEKEQQEKEQKQQERERALQAVLSEHDVMALAYLEDYLPLAQEASFDSEVLVEIPTGQTVFIRNVRLDDDNTAWALVETYFEGQTWAGYIPRFYLACSDEDFLQWESEYIEDARTGMAMYEGEGRNSDIEAFPESYRDALYALKAEHPNWTFVKMNTGLPWDMVIRGEMGEKSLVYKTEYSYNKGDCYDDGDWYYANEGILKYYMDPRNGLTQDRIFQFELLTYNQTYHTEAAVDVFLNDTFMNNSWPAPGTDYTFAHIFHEVGSQLNVSPFHLAARVRQEQQGGTSPLISGRYEGYEGYYNYFNIRASGTSQKEIITNGLEYARSQGWYNAELSIRGGSEVISEKYIRKGQDTLYLQKFNVNPFSPYGLFEHQYMQNIAAPFSEGQKVMKMYAGVNSLNNTFVFKIPVYENMPESPCIRPTGPQDGWHEENGNRYWYENNVRQGTEGRGKEIYDPGTDAWYWLDANENGKMAANKDVYQDSNGGKWVRYDAEGRMVKGADYRNGGWYYFDELTGAMAKGWRTTADGAKCYYDLTTGQRKHGYAEVEGRTLYFLPDTGALADIVWVRMDGADYWFEGGRKQGLEGRGKEIYDPGTDAWYWLDSVDGGRKAVSKDVYQESDGGKWVRYDWEGHMVKGWDYNENGAYYFDLTTGAMVKGKAVIDDEEYYFDLTTGIMRE